jgi:hypothetical protein
MTYLLGLWQVHRLELTLTHPSGIHESGKVKAFGAVPAVDVESIAQVITVKHGLISLKDILMGVKIHEKINLQCPWVLPSHATPTPHMHFPLEFVQVLSSVMEEQVSAFQC